MTDLLSKITAPPSNAEELKPIVPAAPVDLGATPTAATPALDVVPETPVVGEDQLLLGERNGSVGAVPPPVTPTAEPATPITEAPKRGRGRPWGSKNKPAVDDTVSSVPSIADITAQQVAIDYKLMSEATFDMTTGVLATTIGPEWQAQTPQERQGVCSAIEAYFRYKQVKDIPPTMALCLVCCAYAAPRLAQPSTKQKLQLTWLWLKPKLRRLLGFK